MGRVKFEKMMKMGRQKWVLCGGKVVPRDKE